jgi:hypothetical protein
VFLFILAWMLFSIPASLFAGRFIAVGQGHAPDSPAALA